MTPRGRYLWDLLFVLTEKHIKIRYKESWLGYGWSVANPLAFALLYFFAFSVFMRVQVPQYTLFLIVGLFPWYWFSSSVGGAPNAFRDNASLIKKLQFPSHILIVAMVLNDCVHFAMSLPVIIGFLAFYGKTPSWQWVVGLPLLLLSEFLMAYGLALAIASLNLFFRDLERFVALLLTFLFFLSPITYSESMIPPRHHWILHLNPVTPMILCWRGMFLEGQLYWPLAGEACLYSAAFSLMGFAVYRKLRFKFAEVI